MPSVPKYFRTFSSCPRARGSFQRKEPSNQEDMPNREEYFGSDDKRNRRIRPAAPVSIEV
jgi:hypothetical protein